jgi:23S rRNA (cytidine2498-2'-O)-methyltransferase
LAAKAFAAQKDPALAPAACFVTVMDAGAYASGDFAVYLAARGFERELADELTNAGRPVLESRKRLLLAAGPPYQAAWAQNIWLEPFFLPVESVGHAARQLKAIQRNWHCHPIEHFRRAALIAEQLPPVNAKPLPFGQTPPSSPLGAWTLWEREVLLLSASCSSPFPEGEVYFEEDKLGPPSRAYLKLWEVFTVLGIRPESGALCLDLGASPGGWTWALANMGARVFSVDRSPLDPAVVRMPNVDYCRGSGFGLEPAWVGTMDWLFSDMACYPDKLLRTVEQWLKAQAAANYVCTLKFQGTADQAVMNAFRAVPGSRLIHLSCNRHELTWAHLHATAESS